MTEEMRERCQRLRISSEELSRQSEKLRERAAESLRNSFSFQTHKDSSSNPEPYYTQYARRLLL